MSAKVQAAYDKGVALPTPTARTKPLVVFLGDSFTAGNDETPGARKYGYMDRAADQLGWDHVNFGMGGTGYVNPGADGSTNFGGQVWRAVNLAPDVLIVSGGINDRKYPAEQVKVAASALLKDVKAKLPKTKVVVVGPVVPAGMEGKYSNTAPVRDTLQTATEAAGLPFIDPLAEDWMPTIDGFTGPTQFHPNEAGHKMLASKLVPDLKALNLTAK